MIGVDTPILTSERLTLRGWREEDLEPLAALYADEENARYIGGVLTRAEAWRRLAAHIGHWALRGFGMFAVEETATGAFVGFGGPWCPETWPQPEIGYSLAKAHWGKGYATELAIRARAFAYEELGWTTAISLIAHENVASQRVAARLGAVKERDAEVMGYACAIHRHPGPEALGFTVRGRAEAAS